MNIVEAKEKLKKDGYTSFELEEFSPEFYEKLKSLMCNEEKNIKDSFHYLRLDAATYTQRFEDEKQKIRISENFNSFEKASEKRNETIDSIKNKPFKSFQIWFFQDFGHQWFDERDMDIKNEYNKLVKDLMIYFFDFPKEQQYAKLSTFTYYDKGCHLENHSDGTNTGRICALLIYLNETYDEKDGGILILDNKHKVVPTFGKVAIIDLQSFDIPHLVTEVTGGIGRYALLSFIKTKENEMIDKKIEYNY